MGVRESAWSRVTANVGSSFTAVRLCCGDGFGLRFTAGTDSLLETVRSGGGFFYDLPFAKGVPGCGDGFGLLRKASAMSYLGARFQTRGFFCDFPLAIDVRVRVALKR